MASGRIVVREREIDCAVVVEVYPLHAVAGVVIADKLRDDILEPAAAVVKEVIGIVRVRG